VDSCLQIRPRKVSEQVPLYTVTKHFCVCIAPIENNVGIAHCTTRSETGLNFVNWRFFGVRDGEMYPPLLV